MNTQRSKLFLQSVVALILMIAATVTNAKDVVMLESKQTPPRLIELYSSHGCSSCPPAQAWINEFTDSPDLWNRVIPIVFHVDYWDYLGWKDRFANAYFSTRQREYARLDRINSVYTPGFIVNGKEWTGWFRGNKVTSHKLDSISKGKLSVKASESELKISFEQAAGEVYQSSQTALYANIAVLGFKLRTKINAGENARKVLQDDFVVLGYSQVKYKHGSYSYDYPKLSNTAAKYGLVVWLTGSDRVSPIQSVGDYLPKSWSF